VDPSRPVNEVDAKTVPFRNLDRCPFFHIERLERISEFSISQSATWIMAVNDLVGTKDRCAFDRYDLSIMPVSHRRGGAEEKSDYQTESDAAEHAKR